jgi:hypothetical protein
MAKNKATEWKRFFLVSYQAVEHSGDTVTGDVTVKSMEFPSRKFICGGIVVDDPMIDKDKIAITSIFEFRSKKDYEQFNSVH